MNIDRAEGQEVLIKLADQLNTPNNYIGKLWNLREQEHQEQEVRLFHGEKVRTDGTLIIPPNWEQLPKHLRH